MRPKPIKVYEQLLKVRVSGIGGLFDMLRYDNCSPASQEDAAKLERLAYRDISDADRVVEFRRFSRNGNGPTVERWKSFNCDVLSWESCR